MPIVLTSVPETSPCPVPRYWLLEAFVRQFVDVEAPIEVNPSDNPSNEQQADLVISERECATFVSNPQPQDIRSLIEIADRTLNFDRTLKAALYARAGIVEYWVLEMIRRSLFVHRKPPFSGYALVSVFDEHETVSPIAAPNAVFRPSQVFPAVHG